jgi:hypothetical protein
MRPTGTYYGTADVLEACKRMKIDTRGKSWDELQREIEAHNKPPVTNVPLTRGSLTR